MTLLRLTEGLWECVKTILGHRVFFDCRTSFYLKKRQPPAPHPTHTMREGVGVGDYIPVYVGCSSLASPWCFTIQNIAIKGALSLSHSRYFEYIIILAAPSHPAHHHFSRCWVFFFLLLLLCFEEMKASQEEKIKSLGTPRPDSLALEV